MPYSEVVPDVILPDAEGAWQDAKQYEDEGLYVAFCGDYVPDDQLGRSAMRGQCAIRNPWGDKEHNWCYGCMVGYVMSVDDDPMSDSLRIGAVTGSW